MSSSPPNAVVRVLLAFRAACEADRHSKPLPELTRIHKVNLSEEVLMGIAAVSVTLIGFSGVVTALGRQHDRSWSRPEAIQLFALVAPSIVTLVSAFVPVVLNLITENTDLIWRASNDVCFLGHLSGIIYFIRMGSGMTVRFSHKVGLTCTFGIMTILLISVLGIGSWYQFTYLLGLLLGIGVSVHNFYLLLSPAIVANGE